MAPNNHACIHICIDISIAGELINKGEKKNIIYQKKKGEKILII